MISSVLLTGGTGFFGRALLRYFEMTGSIGDTQITIVSRHPSRFQEAHPDLARIDGIFFVQGDIQDRDSLPWDQKFTHVLHAATDSTVGPQLTPLQRYHQIVDGTINLLDLAVSSGASRFLLTSSGGVYGPQPCDLQAIPEDWLGSPPLDEPITAYSQAKRAAEHLCSLYHDQHKIEVIIARCFAFVGQDLPLDAHFAIGNFIRDALYEEEITVSGDASAVRTYLDQRDLANWLWTLLNQGQSGETYNVGSDYVITIYNLALLVRNLLAPHKQVVIKDRSATAPCRSVYVPDIRKIHKMHGLSVTIPLSDAIIAAAQSAILP